MLIEKSKIDGHTLITTRYDSVLDLARNAQKRVNFPREDLPDTDCQQSVLSDKARDVQTGVNSLPEAIAMLEKGWPEGTAKLLRGMDAALNIPSIAALTPSWDYDVSGVAPDVASYCAGIPEHMLTPIEHQTAVQPVLHISIVGCYVWMLKPKDVENYGIALLSIIDAVQQSGRALDIEWIACSTGDDDFAWVDSVPLTTPGQPFDIDRLAVSLHTAFYRRLIWAHWEMHEEIALNMCGRGYGYPKFSAPQWLRQPNRLYLPGPSELYKNQQTKSIQAAANALIVALRNGAADIFKDPSKAAA